MGDCLGDVLRMKVPGSCPRGRLKKSWMDNVKENLRKLNLREDDAYDRDNWRVVIKRQTLLNLGKIRRNMEKVKKNKEYAFWDMDQIGPCYSCIDFCYKTKNSAKCILHVQNVRASYSRNPKD